VFRKFVKLGFAALTFAVALQTGVAQAAFNGSALTAAAAEQAAVVESINWKCGPLKCVWTPGHKIIHPWAVTWGPPRLASCVWTRPNRRAPWVEVCG